MRRNHRRQGLLGCGVAALAFAGVLPSSAWAQADPAIDHDRDAAEAPAGDEITVTGTRIRGVAPVGSNVVAVSQASLQNNTAVNVADILKQVPQVSSIGVDEARVAVQGVNTGNLARSSAINLRGVSPVATLVLLNGHRMIASSAGGIYVDPSAIPTIALERIEVVPDGASAIYGSDAIAGVANLILKRNYSGAETRVRYGMADGYDRLSVAQLLGASWSTGNVMLAYEYVRTGRLEGLERDYFRSNLTAFGGSDYRSPNCNPGNVLVNGSYYALPTMAANTRNRCEISRVADILPQQRKHSVVLTARQELNDSIELFAEGYFSRRDFNARNAPIANAYTVPSSNAFFISPPGTNPSSEIVEFNFLKDFGPVVTRGFTRIISGTAGVRVELPGSWKAELAVSHGDVKEYIYRDAINNAALNAALASSDPATALNPFGVGGATNPVVIAGIFNGLFNPNFRNHSTGVELRADGPLFSLPGGEVRLAIGGEYRDFYMFVDTIRGTVPAPTHTVVEATRKVKSGYAELYVPIFGADNATAGFRRLDLSAAVRVDSYNDVGDTVNPKFGLTWVPVDGLTFNASFGTSFRAPTLSDQLNPGASVTAQNLADPMSPTGTSTGLSYSLFSAPLKPETAKTYSFGAKINPVGLPDLSLSLTYFSLDYDNQVVQLGTTILQQENLYRDQIIRNPTQAQIDALLNSGLPISGTVPAIVNYIINITPANLGGTKVRGFDFAANYRFDLGKANVNVGFDGSYFTKYITQVTPTAPYIDRNNYINYPLKFRARAFANARIGGLAAGLTMNYFNGYKNDLVTPVQNVSSWTTFDANLSYEFDEGFAKGLTLGVDVSSLFDRDPPFVNIDGGYDPGGASALGRMVSLSVTKKW